MKANYSALARSVFMIMAIASLCHTVPAMAQQNSFKFEISPFAAYRIGGQFDDKDGAGEFELDESNAQGIILNGFVGPDAQWEFFYANQDTEVDTRGLFVNDPQIDIDVEYYQFGGTYLFDGSNVRPFIAMTLGLTHFDPQPADFRSESFFSASLGGGVQLNASGRLGVRLEARVFTTFLDNDSAIFCGSTDGAGACLIHVDATILTQWEARAGLVFRF